MREKKLDLWSSSFAAGLHTLYNIQCHSVSNAFHHEELLDDYQVRALDSSIGRDSPGQPCVSTQHLLTPKTFTDGML